jgi:O-antigen ligase
VRNQVVSLATALFTMSPYLLGRTYFQKKEDLVLFTRWAAVSNLIVLLAVGFFFVYYMADLYTARQITAQRIPMMLTFIAWAICAPALWEPRRQKLRVFLWLLAIVVIALSLTRASYLQWAVSAVVFLGISLLRGWLAWKPTLLAAGLMLGAGITGLTMWKAEDGEVNLIVQRASQLLTVRETLAGDESASSRAEIWRRLGDNLKAHPYHLLFGYGQLGPSAYIGGTFMSVSGEFVKAYNAHNQHLDTLVRAGLFGALLEMLIFAMVTVKPLRAIPGQNPGIFQAHSAALFGVFVYGMFHETIRWQMFGLYFWLYAGMVSYHFYSWKPDAERR